MKIQLSLLLMSLGFAVLASDAEVVRVKGKGSGVDEAAALKDAYRDAVETAVGMYVDTEQLVRNDEIIKDEILTHSNAYVLGYEMVDKTVKDGLVWVKIIAKVKKQEVVKKTSAMMEAKTANVGDALKAYHAQTVTKQVRGADAAALMEKELAGWDITKSLIDCNVIKPESVRILKPSQDRPGRARLGYLTVDSINEGRYFEYVVPRLRNLLRQVSISEPKKFNVPVALKRFTDPNSYATEPVTRGICSGELPPNRENALEIPQSLWKLFWASGSCDRYTTNRMLNQDKGIYVALVTKANKLRTVYTAEVYELDAVCARVLAKWQNWMHELAPKPKFSLSFLDEDEEVLEQCQFALEEYGRSCESSVICYLAGNFAQPDGLGMRIVPWYAESAYRERLVWRTFDVPNEALPLIKSIKIEPIE